jgi:hypothetical protein
MPQKLSLPQALKEALQDDNKVSKYEAQVIYQLVITAGHLTQSDRDVLKNALDNDQFDETAYKMLHELLLRSELHK